MKNLFSILIIFIVISGCDIDPCKTDNESTVVIWNNTGEVVLYNFQCQTLTPTYFTVAINERKRFEGRPGTSETYCFSLGSDRYNIDVVFPSQCEEMMYQLVP